MRSHCPSDLSSVRQWPRFCWAGRVPCEEGDTLCYAIVVTDEYGRTTVRGGQEYQVAAASGAEGEMAVDMLDAAGYYTYDDPADWGL